MVKQKEIYKGKEIVIETNEHGEHHEHGSEISLSIDGEPIHVMKSNNRYSSHHLPYDDYDSVLALAKAIIDIVPSFRQQPNK